MAKRWLGVVGATADLPIAGDKKFRNLSPLATKSLREPSSRTDGTGPSGPQLGVSRPQGEGKHVQYIGEAGDIVVMHRQVLTRLATEDSL